VVAHQGYRATYAQLWEQVDQAARAFLAYGVRKGDRVGIWAPNRYEWVVTQFATARVGAILVTINPAYRAAELEYALTRAGVSMLVLARGLGQTDYVAMLDEVRARCPELRATVVLDDEWDMFLSLGSQVDARELAARKAQLRDGATATPEQLAAACQGAHRQVQDPSVLEDRRLLPDDRHREDPEVPDARDRRR
jgi:fatty-acyl-CoA synthase